MMRAFFATVLLIATTSVASAGSGFWAGAAEGLRQNEELEMERRALELDALRGGRARDEYEMRRLRRAIEENNRLMQQQQMHRFIWR